MTESVKKELVIVEDEKKIASLLSDYLSNADYQVTILNEGTEAVEVINRIKPACVILDVMLPGKDGLQICRELRQDSDIPIIMITARVDEIDRLLGLELGADDYICKPFSPREVVVRVKNLVRRSAAATNVNSNKPSSSTYLEYRDLILDSERLSCDLQGVSITLTAVEFRILFAMVARAGNIFSRDQLMNEAYTDQRVVSDRTIDTHIKNLRKKLNTDTDDEYVHSIYGVGYKVS